MSRPLEILIVGAGIAGPTLATFLLLSPDNILPPSQKPHITILERSSTFRAQGQNIDIRGVGKTIVRKLGLLPAIEASSTGELGVRAVDERDRIWSEVAATETGPTSDVEIMRGRLAELCYLRCKSVSDQVKSQGGEGVDFIYGDYLDSITQEDNSHSSRSGTVSVHFAKANSTRHFDMVVGADGLQSSTRRLAFPGNDAHRIHSLHAYGGFFSMPRAPTDSLWRRFYHAPGRRGIMLRPNKPAGTTTAFMTVVVVGGSEDSRLEGAAFATAARGRGEVVGEQKALLAEYFSNAGWESPRVIEQMHKAEDFYFDAIAQVKMERWSHGRVVLLGDAGYCASPISGMGTTLALTGAYNLAGSILRHLVTSSSSSSGGEMLDDGDVQAAFDEYHTLMKPIVTKAQKLPPGMPKLLYPETWWGIWLLLAIPCFLQWSGILAVLFKFVGPGSKVKTVDIVEDFGFRELEVLEE